MINPLTREGFLIDWDLSRLVTELGTGPVEPDRSVSTNPQTCISHRDRLLINSNRGRGRHVPLCSCSSHASHIAFPTTWSLLFTAIDTLLFASTSLRLMT